MQKCEQGNSDKTKKVHVELSIEDKAWIEKFFKDFFLEAPVIYTIFGTKPMSCITINKATKNEWIEASKPYWKNLPEKRKKKALNELENYCETYDLYENWDKWISWKKNYPNSPFLFRKQSTEFDKIFNVYIINAKEVLWSLQKNYLTFSQELGSTFDPLEVTLDFENSQSNFWDQVLSNHLLQGILFGFGEKNSYFFSREMKDKEKIECLLDKRLSLRNQLGKNKNEEIFIQRMRLPSFRSYEDPYREDPIIIKYKKERKLIQKYLKGKNLFEELLKKLTNCAEIDLTTVVRQKHEDEN